MQQWRGKEDNAGLSAKGPTYLLRLTCGIEWNIGNHWRYTMTRQARRLTRELTPDEKARLEKARAAVADELPELVAQGQLLKDAAEENTFSGALRRAIHASDLSIDQVAEKSGISISGLDPS